MKQRAAEYSTFVPEVGTDRCMANTLTVESVVLLRDRPSSKQASSQGRNLRIHMWT